MKKVIIAIALAFAATTASADSFDNLEVVYPAKLFASVVYHCQDDKAAAKSIGKKVFTPVLADKSPEVKEYAKSVFGAEINRLKATTAPMGCANFIASLEK